MAQPEVIPSSPPLILHASFDQDIPSSPLPYSSTPRVILPNRKRQLSDYDSSLSSDPLFSEDPSEAEDITQYGRPRRKRMVKGPWWITRGSRLREQDDPLVKDSEVIARNFDSGVFMGSDMSEESIDNVMSSNHRPRQTIQQNTRVGLVSEQTTTRSEAVAQHIVYQCLDSGKEAVDLSDLRLTRLAPQILSPLHQLIRHSHNSSTEPPSEDAFTVLTPDIKLFLAGNDLAYLPDELFLLKNITVLSLRNNQLAELSSSIGRLRRLQELNIAGNSIEFLPWELLQYFRGADRDQKRVTVRPNPLLEPVSISGRSQLLCRVDGLTDMIAGELDPEACLQALRQQFSADGPLDVRSELELRLRVGRLMEGRHIRDNHAGLATPHQQLIHLASSSVYLFDIDGKPRQPRTVTDLKFVATVNQCHTPVSAPCTPSLFELAIRSVQAHYHLDAIPETMPESVQTALRNAAKAGRLGNRKCSTCQRPFVTARAQWVEYWYNGMSSQAHLTQETVLPFMRFACSWGCAEPSQVGEFKY